MLKSIFIMCINNLYIICLAKLLSNYSYNILLFVLSVNFEIISIRLYTI